MSSLRCNGYLKQLKNISEPDFLNRDVNEDLIFSYVTVIDAVGKAVTTEALIQPDYLQHFLCADTLLLQELSRLHLF
ncbi:hypothetical protein HMPREF1544_01561 [Mucor circinelloides 1006PhL]|uniref:Uncharacterized protein n=1 Tax=Mucor circinelloides f. circinelloides (strain 1006PhL) TaxID=1220926 RepID=S2JNW1_MUCC1|nr:hypothetical protein HMPREF1544_01561 [Mucor circinelloides 1006PhL]